MAASGFCAGSSERPRGPDILLVGPYPPPLGGVSAHVERLARAIRARGLTVQVVNHFRGRVPSHLIADDLRRNPWRYWRVLRAARARVVHYHHSRWSTLLACAVALRRSRASAVATVHGRELERFLRSRIPGVAAVTRWALGGFDVLIAVSVEIDRSLRGIGPPVAIIPAYLPAGDDEAQLSSGTQAFLRRGTTLLVSAYRLTVDGHGRTIYGLETAIDSFAVLAPGRPDLQLAIFLGAPPRSRRESERLKGLIGRAGEGEVGRRIGVFCGEPMAPALPLTAVYLRPTLTDGDAVSVREALAAGTPVLASDVVRRPAGVVTVGAGPADWAGAIARSLAGPRSAPAAGAAADPVAALLAIYGQLGCSAGRPGGAGAARRAHAAASSNQPR